MIMATVVPRKCWEMHTQCPDWFMVSRQHGQHAWAKKSAKIQINLVDLDGAAVQTNLSLCQRHTK